MEGIGESETGIRTDSSRHGDRADAETKVGIEVDSRRVAGRLRSRVVADPGKTAMIGTAGAAANGRETADHAAGSIVEHAQLLFIRDRLIILRHHCAGSIVSKIDKLLFLLEGQFDKVN